MSLSRHITGVSISSPIYWLASARSYYPGDRLGDTFRELRKAMAGLNLVAAQAARV